MVSQLQPQVLVTQPHPAQQQPAPQVGVVERPGPRLSDGGGSRRRRLEPGVSGGNLCIHISMWPCIVSVLM